MACEIVEGHHNALTGDLQGKATVDCQSYRHNILIGGLLSL